MLLWRTFSSIRRVFSYAGRAHPLSASPSWWRLLIIWAAKDSTPPNPRWLCNNHNDDGKNWDNFTSLKWILEPQSTSCSCVKLRLVDVETVIVGYRLLKCDFKRIGTVTANLSCIKWMFSHWGTGSEHGWARVLAQWTVWTQAGRAWAQFTIQASVFWKRWSRARFLCIQARHSWGEHMPGHTWIVSRTRKCTTVVFDGLSRLNPNMAAHRRCWRSKVGRMVVVGDSKVRNNMPGNNSDSTVHRDALNCSKCKHVVQLVSSSCASTVCKPTKPHIATYCVGQCTPYASAQLY